MATRRRSSPRRRSPSTETLHPKAESLDLASALEIVRLLQAEDLRAVRAVRAVATATARAAERISRCLRDGGRLIYLGAGTSGRLGVLDAAECPPTFGTSPDQVVGIIAGGEPALRQAIEGAEDDPAAAARTLSALSVGARDVVCGISASARTPFVLAGLQAARERGAHTVLVCCARPETPRLADRIIHLDTGPELVAGSTRLKAGTATKLVLNALSTAALVRAGKVFRGRMVDLQPTNDKLRRRAERIVAELAEVDAAEAERLLQASQGSVRVALAMAYTGLDAAEARARSERDGLRRLARKAPGRGRRSPSK